MAVPQAVQRDVPQAGLRNGISERPADEVRVDRSTVLAGEDVVLAVVKLHYRTSLSLPLAQPCWDVDRVGIEVNDPRLACLRGVSS